MAHACAAFRCADFAFAFALALRTLTRFTCPAEWPAVAAKATPPTSERLIKNFSSAASRSGPSGLRQKGADVAAVTAARPASAAAAVRGVLDSARVAAVRAVAAP